MKSYQSSNEELEISKEEIQSMNEELSTVNSQLNFKIEELTGVNNDLVNFLNSSEIGTIFLDNELRVRRFTPSAAKLMNLISSDVGRPLSHTTNKFIDLDLVADGERVLRNLSVIEKEVQTSDGLSHAMRCLPYRTLDNKIDGVIFTFNDVTRLKRSEEAMQEARNYAEGIVETVREALVVLDSKLRVVSANRASTKLPGFAAGYAEPPDLRGWGPQLGHPELPVFLKTSRPGTATSTTSRLREISPLSATGRCF